MPFFRGSRRLSGPEITQPFGHQRQRMVDEQLRPRGIQDPNVLAAMVRVPRHEFLSSCFRHAAYSDHALPVAEGETLSQPYIVALTCQALELQPGAHVLDVGSGTGYQSAVLAAMGCVVWGVEIDPQLTEVSRARLERLGVSGVELRAGDGSLGWPEHAPFDGIAVAAAAPEVPPALLRQLREGARLVAPLGRGDEQMLVRVTRGAGGFERENLTPVRFVPMRKPK